jgi:CBS domain-containing protein
MTNVHEVMTRNVITLAPDSSAEAAIRQLLKHKISGAPVVDREGRLLGIISEYQLLAVVYDEAMKHRPVRELMTANVVSVEETASIMEVADLFIVQRIRRLPVVRDGRVVGLISRRDLLSHAVTLQPESFGQIFRMLSASTHTA